MSAKCNLLVVIAIPAIAAVPLLACGSDSKTPDAGHSIDAPGSGSGSGSGSNDNLCPLPTNLGTITSFADEATTYRSGTGFGSGSGSGSAAPRANRLTFTGALDGSDTEEVQITIYGGCTAGSGCAGSVHSTPDWPAMFGPKSGVDMAQAVDVSAIAAAGVGSNGRPSVLYALMTGTLNVTAAGNGSGAPFAGDASNMTFVHVDFGSGGQTADPDGCTTTITSLTFSGSAAFAGKVGAVADLDPDDNAVQYLHHRWQ